MEEQKRLEVETRPCKDCKHYEVISLDYKSCNLKHMRVIAEMKVAYYKSEGTCFEEKENKQNIKEEIFLNRKKIILG